MIIYHSPDIPTNCIGFKGIRHSSRRLVHFRQVNLNGCVILCMDDPVTGRAVIFKQKKIAL